MWKLFPPSWFDQSDPTSRRHAVAVAQLEKEWRQWVDAALERRLHVQPDGTTDTYARLMALNGSDLLALDQGLRVGHWTDYQSTPVRRTPVPTPIQSDRNEAEAYLFVASCNPNGFLREQALNSFHHYLGHLALAAALIRCDDWVPNVRAAAVKLLDVSLARSQPSAIFHHFDLLLRLMHRQRAAELWSSRIQPALLSSQNRDARWLATQHGDPARRILAYELVIEADADRLPEALHSATQDPHPVVARWAVNHLHRLTPEDRHVARAHALKHAYASVRQLVIRQYAAEHAPELRAMLREMLFDRSRGPRGVAAFELQHLFQENPLPFWREALRNARGARSNTAILALSEFGEREDIDALASHAEHRTALIRESVLCGLSRLDATDLSTHLRRALQDPCKSIVRRAVEMYARGSESLEPEELMEALNAANERTRPVLIRASHMLGKWPALAFLLRACVAETDATARASAVEIKRWVGSSSGKFTRLSAEIERDLPALIEAARARHPMLPWRLLSQAVESGA